jgi:hypothetical protein
MRVVSAATFLAPASFTATGIQDSDSLHHRQIDVRWLDLTVRAQKLIDLPTEHLRQPTEVPATCMA